MYNPVVKGSTDARKFVQFMAGELHRINGVPESEFDELVNNVEQTVVQLLPGADPGTVAWTIFVLGHLEGQSDKLNGLFWQAIGDALITREETRSLFGEELLPRPERKDHADTDCSCGGDHEVVTIEQRIQEAKDHIIPALEAQALAARAAQAAQSGDPAAFLRMLGQMGGAPDGAPGPINLPFPGGEMRMIPLNPGDLPPGAELPDILRFIADKESQGTGTDDASLRRLLGEDEGDTPPAS